MNLKKVLIGAAIGALGAALFTFGMNLSYKGVYF